MPTSGTLKGMTHFEHRDVKIVAFVGLAGAGKTSAAEYISGKGYPKVYFGGVILNAMKEADIPITAENEASFREEIREKEGKDFVARRAIKQAHDLIASGQKRILLDGLYTWTEYKLLKHEFPGELSVIAIVAPKRLRHRRLAVRPERPFTDKEASDRDWSEIENLEKGGPIAMADYFIINNGDLEKFYEQIDVALTDIEFI
jgi:dephospho-CoA kinase